MTGRLPRGMAADVIAFERAEEEFERLHGDEARARWTALGAGDGESLAALQLEVVERGSLGPAEWEAFAWEVERRIELLERARAEQRRARAAA